MSFLLAKLLILLGVKKDVFLGTCVFFACKTSYSLGVMKNIR